MCDGRLIAAPRRHPAAADLRAVALTIGLAELTARARGARVLVPGVRGVYRGDFGLPGGKPDRHTRGGLAGIPSAGAGLRQDMSGFDFDIIRRSLPYLFLEGMRFT